MSKYVVSIVADTMEKKIYAGVYATEPGNLALFEVKPGGTMEPVKLGLASGQIVGAPNCYEVPSDVWEATQEALKAYAATLVLIDIPVGTDIQAEVAAKRAAVSN